MNTLKYALQIFPQLAVTYRKTFVCLCRRTLSPIHTIFNMDHSISSVNRTYINFKTFEEYLREHTETDGQTDQPIA